MSDDCGAWQPFGLTAVAYQSDDGLSYFLAFVSLAPPFLIAMLTALLAFRRDWQTFMLLVGLILNVVLNKVLKSTFREPRPSGSCALEYSGSLLSSGSGGAEEYGMPSNHAQFVAFFAAFLSLFLLRRTTGAPLAERLLLSAGLCGGAGLVAYARVYLGYHSASQVAAGVTVGATAGAVWFLAYAAPCGWFGLERAGKAAAAHPFAKVLKLRDTSACANMVTFEHAAYAAQAAYAAHFGSRGNGSEERNDNDDGPRFEAVFEVPPEELRAWLRQRREAPAGRSRSWSRSQSRTPKKKGR